MAAQPQHKLVEAELICPIECREEFVRLFGVRCETRAIDGEKSIRGGESCAFVAVEEGMILREALPERGGFFDQVDVIAGLGAVESGFEQSLVSDTLCPAVAFDEVGVHRQHFSYGQEVGHSASFLKRRPYLSWLARYTPMTCGRGLAFLRFSIRSAR